MIITIDKPSKHITHVWKNYAALIMCVLKPQNYNIRIYATSLK